MRRLVLFLCACLVATAALAPAGAKTPEEETRPFRRPAEAPRPTYTDYTYERVRAPMRDGVELSMDIWRPVTPKNVKVPIVLSLTPYHSLYRALDTNEQDLPSGDAAIYVPKGYAYVRADVRGTWNSGGCWNYGGRNEVRDGYDLVEWLAKRDWTNGNVAMTGASYDGTTANAAAVGRPPHLKTIIPVSAISQWWGYAYQQGSRSTYSGESLDIDPPSDTPTDFMFAYGFIPPPEPGSVTNAEQIAMRWNLCNRVKKAMKGYDTEPDYDAWWLKRDYLQYAHRVDIPVLVTHGQLDFNVKTWEGTQWFEALDGPKVMVIGQWPHASPRGNYPEWDRLLERWLERWLYGVKNGVEKTAPVIVQTNDGKWHEERTWAGTHKRTLGLGKGTFSYLDDGTLTESEMLRRSDDSRFLRLKLDKSSGIRIAGRPVLHLKAESDSPSTHFISILLDVDKNGTSKVISRAFMNARYRDSLEKGKDLKPGERYTFDLEFIDKDHIVAKDHHLELIVASSSNTWVAPDESRATNTIYLDDSTLELPLR